MLWGPRDPVFSDRYLRDLIDRLPHADVHRFEGAGHLVPEDRDIAAPVFTWLADAAMRDRGRRGRRRPPRGASGRGTRPTHASASERAALETRPRRRRRARRSAARAIAAVVDMAPLRHPLPPGR